MVATHTLTGSVSNVGIAGGFVAAGRASTRLAGVEEPQAFALEVDEGPHSVVFARHDIASPTPAVQSVVLRRDLAVATAFEQSTDFSDGLPTSNFPVGLVIGSAGCLYESAFSFGDTVIALGQLENMIVAPHREQWRGGDHLTFTVTCVASTGAFRVASVDIAIHEYIPIEVVMPYELGPPQLSIDGRRFDFAWNGYGAPAEYHAIVGPRTCESCAPRWAARISDGFIGDGPTRLVALSPPDLEQLGLMDPALEISADSPWSLFAIPQDSASLMLTGSDQFSVSP
jgi:hypothetical protein